MLEASSAGPVGADIVRSPQLPEGVAARGQLRPFQFRFWTKRSAGKQPFFTQGSPATRCRGAGTRRDRRRPRRLHLQPRRQREDTVTLPAHAGGGSGGYPDTSVSLFTDCATSVSLLAQLPLTLSFRDHGGQEKNSRLPAPLDLAGAPDGSDAAPLTIGYCVPNQVSSSTNTTSDTSPGWCPSAPMKTPTPLGRRH